MYYINMHHVYTARGARGAGRRAAPQRDDPRGAPAQLVLLITMILLLLLLLIIIIIIVIVIMIIAIDKHTIIV